MSLKKMSIFFYNMKVDYLPIILTKKQNVIRTIIHNLYALTQ